MSNPLKILAGQTAIYGLSSILGRFLNYLLTPLWTHKDIFSKEQFGIITEMYAYVAFLVVFLTYGMETTFFRFASKQENDANKIFSTAYISVFLSSFAFVLICIIFMPNIANWLMYPNHQEYVMWFAIIVSLDAISSFPLARLRLQNKATTFALINFANIGVNIGLNIFFLYYCKRSFDAGNSSWLIETFYNPNIGVGYVFIANLIASIVKFVLLIPYSNLGKLQFDFYNYKKMVRYTYPLLFVGLAGFVNETIDRILLKRLLINQYSLKETLGYIGIYGANYKLSLLITLFIQAYRYAAEPFFFNQEKKSDSKKTYSDLMHYFIIVVAFIFLLVMLNIDFVKYFINNEELWEGLDIVPILLFANIFLGIYYNLSIWYKLSEKTGYGAIISILGAVFTIVLNLILIPIIGFRGSAWATLFCYLGMALMSYYWGKKHYPIPYKIKKGTFYLILVLVLYFLSLLIKLSFHNNWLEAALNGFFLLLYLYIAIRLEKISIRRFFAKNSV